MRSKRRSTIIVVGGALAVASAGYGLGTQADDGTAVARLLVFNPATGQAETRAFLLDGPDRRIGDLAALPDGRMLVVEQGVTAAGGAWGANLYVLDPFTCTEKSMGPVSEKFCGVITSISNFISTAVPLIQPDHGEASLKRNSPRRSLVSSTCSS